MQGHVGACETQVLAQHKSTFVSGVFAPENCAGLLYGEHAIPCSLTPKSDGARAIRDSADWATATMECRGPYLPATAKGGRATDYTVSRTVSLMRAIPVVPPDWVGEGDTLPVHPQDDHKGYIFFRFEPAARRAPGSAHSGRPRARRAVETFQLGAEVVWD